MSTSVLKKKKGKVGRNPVDDPKVAVTFYIQQSQVNKLGGMERAREFCINQIVTAKAVKI
jgi:hypothetical protein